MQPLLTTAATTNDAAWAAWFDVAQTAGAVALIDKAIDWTSFDVIAKLRGITKIKKIGHAGTLDPLATGLLIVCFGKATKTIDGFQAQKKSYRAVVKLGATTKTDDAEAEEENAMPTDHLTNQAVELVVQSFVGEIEQIPPMFSAIKKNGVPLYKLARKGHEIERSARQVEIYSITIVSCELPLLTIDIECSKGTYIRSLARDIGSALGCGAYLAGLRRTAIGSYSVNDAVSVAAIAEAAARRKNIDANAQSQ